MRLRGGRCLGRSPAAGSYRSIGLRRERRRERGVALAQLLERAREQLRRGKEQMGLGRLEWGACGGVCEGTVERGRVRT